MDAVPRPSSWILILALTGHGAIPGVVICTEPSGQVRVEAIAIACCAADPAASGAVADPVVSALPDVRESCGPCQDSPVSPTPVTKPARGAAVGVSAPPGVLVSRVPPAPRMVAGGPGLLVSTQTALIPIKTTTLLI